MSITESSSRTSIPQEVENPSSFNFSIPPPEESPSIPVCGAGEMVESISPPADILVSPVLHSRNTLVCSPTLVLSSEKSPILEEQSVAKSNEGPFSEETNIGSMGASSTIFERAFEGDLPEGKIPESCSLTAGAELVAVKSLASLRGDVQPISLEHELESPDQVPPRSEPIFDQIPKSFDVGSDKEEEEVLLKWRSRGMRGANQSQVNVSELEAVKGTSEVDIVENSAERAKEQQRKGKGKLVLSHFNGDKGKYVTRSETQKVMGSAIAASKAHTERTRKRRRERLKPEQPASTPLSIRIVKVNLKMMSSMWQKEGEKLRKKGLNQREIKKGERNLLQRVQRLKGSHLLQREKKEESSQRNNL